MSKCKYHYTSNRLVPFDRCLLDGAPCILSRLVNARCPDYEPREESENARNITENDSKES